MDEFSQPLVSVGGWVVWLAGWSVIELTWANKRIYTERTDRGERREHTL